MVKIYPWLHSTFKDLSNDISHSQIRVQMKKLCHQQVREENKSLSRFCRDRVSKKLCRDKPRFCHDRVSNKTLSQQTQALS